MVGNFRGRLMACRFRLLVYADVFRTVVLRGGTASARYCLGGVLGGEVLSAHVVTCRTAVMTYAGLTVICSCSSRKTLILKGLFVFMASRY